MSRKNPSYNDYYSKFNENQNINKNFCDKNKLTRVFFNSVTGALMQNDADELSMFEIDSDDQEALENYQIEQYTDVSLNDKKLFKIWNSYIKDKDILKCKMEEYLIEFINKSKDYIFQNNLKENLFLHCICLLDYGLINKEILSNAIDLILDLEKTYLNNDNINNNNNIEKNNNIENKNEINNNNLNEDDIEIKDKIENNKEDDNKNENNNLEKNSEEIKN